MFKRVGRAIKKKTMYKSRYCNLRSNDKAVEIYANTALYPQEPLYATCCVFMDNYYVRVDLSKNKKMYKIFLMPKIPRRKRIDLRKLSGEFQNELMNNLLRYRIAARNQRLRECIVKEALFFSQPRKELEKTIREAS